MDAAPMTPAKMKVAELKAELESRGLSAKGLKKDLVARLELALATPIKASKPEEPLPTASENAETETVAEESEVPDYEAEEEGATTVATGRRGRAIARADAESTAATPSQRRGRSRATGNQSDQEVTEEITEQQKEQTSSETPVKATARSPSPSKSQKEPSQQVKSSSDEKENSMESSVPSSPPKKGNSKVASPVKPEIDESMEGESTEAPVEEPPKPVISNSNAGSKRKVNDDEIHEADKKAKVVQDGSTDEEATETLVVRNLTRPFTLSSLKNYLSQDGEVKEFWIDGIKTHCVVTYESTDAACKTLRRITGVAWPENTGKNLSCEYVSEDEADRLKNSDPRVGPRNTASKPAGFGGFRSIFAKATQAAVESTAKVVVPSPTESHARNDSISISSTSHDSRPKDAVYNDPAVKRTKVNPIISYRPWSDEEVAARKQQGQEKSMDVESTA